MFKRPVVGLQDGDLVVAWPETASPAEMKKLKALACINNLDMNKALRSGWF